MAAVEVERFAVTALREFLALKLPSRVSTVNASRFAVLKTPTAGPWTIPVGATLVMDIRTRDGGLISVPLTSGTRTSAQVAAEIEAVRPGFATVDGSDRLVLTSPNAPDNTGPSVVSLSADSTGANAAFGWDAGGEYDERSALVAPSFKGIMDGEPLHPDPSIFTPGSMVLLFDDRSSTPRSQNVREDLYWVELDLALFFIEPHQQLHRNREPIHACLRAVRECLLLDAGRYAGWSQTTNQGIQKVIERSARISGRTIPLTSANVPNSLMDIAELKLGVLVFERPDAT